MSKSKDAFIKMREEQYFEMPKEFRDQITLLRIERDDWEELSKDETFCNLYKEFKKAKKRFEEYKYKLRGYPVK